jgi:hypothetical protein
LGKYGEQIRNKSGPISSYGAKVETNFESNFVEKNLGGVMREKSELFIYKIVYGNYTCMMGVNKTKEYYAFCTNCKRVYKNFELIIDLIYNSYQRYRAEYQKVANEIENEDIFDPKKITESMEYIGEIDYVYSGFYLEIRCLKCGTIIFSEQYDDEILNNDEDVFITVNHEDKTIHISEYLEEYEYEILNQLYEINPELEDYTVY